MRTPRLSTKTCRNWEGKDFEVWSPDTDSASEDEVDKEEDISSEEEQDPSDGD